MSLHVSVVSLRQCNVCGTHCHTHCSCVGVCLYARRLELMPRLPRDDADVECVRVCLCVRAYVQRVCGIVCHFAN